MHTYPKTLTCDRCGHSFVVADDAALDEAMRYVVAFHCPPCTAAMDREYMELCRRSPLADLEAQHAEIQARERAIADDAERWAIGQDV